MKIHAKRHFGIVRAFGIALLFAYAGGTENAQAACRASKPQPDFCAGAGEFTRVASLGCCANVQNCSAAGSQEWVCAPATRTGGLASYRYEPESRQFLKLTKEVTQNLENGCSFRMATRGVSGAEKTDVANRGKVSAATLAGTGSAAGATAGGTPPSATNPPAATPGGAGGGLAVGTNPSPARGNLGGGNFALPEYATSDTQTPRGSSNTPGERKVVGEPQRLGNGVTRTQYSDGTFEDVSTDNGVTTTLTTDPRTGARTYQTSDGTTVQTRADGSLDDSREQKIIYKQGGRVSTENVANGKDPCSVSSGINDKYGCSGVASLKETANVTNQASQAVGSMALGIAGQRSVVDAQQQGTQSAAYEAAAKQGELAAKYALGVGAANAAFAIMQNAQRSKHRKLENELKDKSAANSIVVQNRNVMERSGNQDNVRILAKSGLARAPETYEKTMPGSLGIAPSYSTGAGRITGTDPASLATRQALQAQEDRHNEQLIRSKVNQVRGSASNEQARAATDAKTNMMASTILAAKSLMEGKMGLDAAKKMREVAKEVNALEQKGGILPGFDGTIDSNPVVARQGTGLAIGGGGQYQGEAEAADESQKDDTVGDLGDPTYLGNPSGEPKELIKPGSFQARDNFGGGGGGGGGGLGGGSATQAARDDSGGEASARYAENKPVSTSYGAAGAQVAPANGARGGSGGGDGGVDLNSLLAQFLPKGPEEGAAQPQSIMDFGSGSGRGPASDTPASLLDRSVNLFERISKTYLDKSQRGFVGL